MLCTLCSSVYYVFLNVCYVSVMYVCVSVVYVCISVFRVVCMRGVVGYLMICEVCMYGLCMCMCQERVQVCVREFG